MKHLILLLLVAAVLTSCGGGGSDPAVPGSAQPTLQLSLSADKAFVGDPVTLTWSTTNATSCQASGAWAGPQTTNGTARLSAPAGGRQTYTLQCSGAGGSTSRTASLTVPMPVWPSSYENAKKIVLEQPSLPWPVTLGITPGFFFVDGFAFADFFGEGGYAAVVERAGYLTADLSTPPNGPSTIFFLRKNDQGNWIDATSALLSNTTGCVGGSRKTLIADFNGDKRPDAFLVCFGYDAPPFPGEQQRILLSQPDGSYRNVRLPFSAVAHGGTAADLNGDGAIDVILTSTNSPGSRPFVLLNNGDGSFRRDDTRIPAEMNERPIYSLELIDVRNTGKPDLFVGAVPVGSGDPAYDPYTYPNAWLQNDGSGNFSRATRIDLPNSVIADSPQGRTYSLALDFVYANGHLYMSQVVDGYTRMVVRKISLADLSSSLVYSTGAFADESWFSWIYAMADGTLRIQSANCPWPIPTQGRCSASFR